MRAVKLLFVLSLIFGCNKVKKNPDYTRFIGTWISIPNTAEQTLVTFSKNGKIGIETSGERGVYFKPNTYTVRKSNDETLDLPFWDEYNFRKEQLLKESISRTMTINPTNDTLIMGKKIIKDFVADSLFYVILVKT